MVIVVHRTHSLSEGRLYLKIRVGFDHMCHHLELSRARIRTRCCKRYASARYVNGVYLQA